jgi:hypothetical protein
VTATKCSRAQWAETSLYAHSYTQMLSVLTTATLQSAASDPPEPGPRQSRPGSLAGPARRGARDARPRRAEVFMRWAAKYREDGFKSIIEVGNSPYERMMIG